MLKIWDVLYSAEEGVLKKYKIRRIIENKWNKTYTISEYEKCICYDYVNYSTKPIILTRKRYNDIYLYKNKKIALEKIN